MADRSRERCTLRHIEVFCKLRCSIGEARPKADRVDLHASQPEEYERRILGFLAKHLRNEAQPLVHGFATQGKGLMRPRCVGVCVKVDAAAVAAIAVSACRELRGGTSAMERELRSRWMTAVPRHL